jgi:hypothetical protein
MRVLRKKMTIDQSDVTMTNTFLSLLINAFEFLCQYEVYSRVVFCFYQIFYSYIDKFSKVKSKGD